MILDYDKKMQNIITAQLVSVNQAQIVAKAEDGEVLTINTSEKQRADPLFWAALKNILTAGLWIPVGRHFHQLLSFDWMVPTTAIV
ncbi:hypothetical protein [Loigolactobacillus zhaoyuanensis]|uniref:Uncharacterized protein n=1 Tax=Loigolactobacillus zhaoyuanensis TaxID=2486017 RepID=A0ABW8UD88_9LACO|nr:hypothetical protein [Loigolactobacillus zhaoyuanensis]